MTMKSKSSLPPAPARFNDVAPLAIAGLRARFSAETCNAIPALWQRFSPYFGRVSGRIGPRGFGVKFHASDAQGTFDYLAGMQVSPDAALPPELARVRLPACRFAVFLHHGHVSQLHETVRDAFGSWLPYSGHAARSDDGMPEFLEVYTEAFEPTAGRGGMEVWVPLAD